MVEISFLVLKNFEKDGAAVDNGSRGYFLTF